MAVMQKVQLNVKLIYGFDQRNLLTGNIQLNNGSMSKFNEIQMEQAANNPYHLKIS